MQATYVRDSDQTLWVLGGASTKHVILDSATSSEAIRVLTTDFLEHFSSTCEHNHDEACCSEHGTHVMPHRGCALR
jgi:hypothetical protein